MPRKARKYVRAPFFHIMCQGIKKELIFRSDEDMSKYLVLIKDYAKIFFVNIVSYCIMPNHTHMLVHSYNIQNISKFMHKTNTIYAMHYNDSNDRVGYVFRDRFRLEEITDLKYLQACINYIHSNPIKAGLCSQSSEYKYSSYNEFVYSPKIINTNILLHFLGENFTKEILKSNFNEDFTFLDIENTSDQKTKTIIENFVKIKSKDLKTIMGNHNDRKELLINLCIKNKISYRCVERNLNINRKIIPKYLFAQKRRA